MSKERRYYGMFINGKMVYYEPVYNHLTSGNWKNGWGGIGQTGGDEIKYEITNTEGLVEKQKYHFILVDGKAEIVK